MASDMTQEVLAIFREEALELIQRTMSALNRAVNGDVAERARHINEVCRLLHTLKGAAAAVDEDDIKGRAHTLEDRIAELAKSPDPHAFDPLFAELEAIENKLAPKAVAAAPAPAPEPAPAPAPAPARSADKPRPPLKAKAAPAGPAPQASDGGAAFAEWLRVSPERIDHLHAQLGELVLTRLQQDRLVERMVHLRTSATRAMTRERELSRALFEARADLPPELWRRLKGFTQSSNTGWSSLVDNLQTVCRDARVIQAQSAVVSQSVEESIQGLRLMPLAPFFEGYAKSVRDAARRSAKEVRFRVRADGTEIDRAVLTRLSDALLHLVRNAVVHGLEKPEQRRAHGKSAEGNLTLEARSAGTHAVISVIDDGSGVDEEKVRQKARALGLDDGAEVLELLTHPGFSTKDSVDELSGRGVGLDVVHGIVRGLGGTLELSSIRNQGTLFTIRVPIAASTTMGLVLELGRHRFGVLMGDVERVLRPVPGDIQQIEGRAAVRVGKEPVALVSLRDVLGLTEEGDGGSHIPVVVLRHGRHRLALAVDEIPGEHAFVVRPFGVAFKNAELFIGGAVQPDHSVVPVIGTAALFARAMRTTGGNLTRKLGSAKKRAPSNLHALVVDDSITMRTLLRNVLTAAGYQVTVAEDGVSALERLDEMASVNIVITDLQMPRMDGIELVKQIRARPGSYVPIVMVTSVDEDEEKSRAIAAGADAYVVKASFEQALFLKRVDTLVRGPA
jgi:two-component system chemotaxis sensor kinase CheA